MKYLIIAIAVIFVLSIMQKLSKRAGHKAQQEERFPYIKQKLFTPTEYKFYWKLKEVADRYNATILAKIRLADIIKVSGTKDRSEFKKYFNKIQSKHIDFVICNSDLYVKFLIELDDKSHDSPKRKERDSFVDKATDAAGLKLIHIKTNYEDLESILKPMFESDTSEAAKK